MYLEEDHDVLWFDVSMNNFPPMQMFHCLQRLKHNIATELLPLFPLQPINHTPIPCILHQQKHMELIMEMPISLDHIGVINHVTDLELPDKLVDHLVFFNCGFHDLFQGTDEVGALVAAEVNLAEFA